MARGWESKSVEEQIDSADRSKQPSSEPSKSQPEQLKKSMLLSRTRVLNDLANCTNSRYKKLLEEALADLDRKLAELGSVD